MNTHITNPKQELGLRIGYQRKKINNIDRQVFLLGIQRDNAYADIQRLEKLYNELKVR